MLQQIKSALVMQETYFLIFTYIVAIAILLHFANLLCIKITGKTVLGQDCHPGTALYKKLEIGFNSRSLALASLFSLGAIANFTNSMRRILRLDNAEYANFITIYFLPSLMIFTVIIFLIVRQKYKSR